MITNCQIAYIDSKIIAKSSTQDDFVNSGKNCNFVKSPEKKYAFFNDYVQRLIALCRKYKVRKLYAFGPNLSPRLNDGSKVDILVNFNEEINHNNYADNFFDFCHVLKSLFGRDVDLIDETSVKNPYFMEELEETKHLVYV